MGELARLRRERDLHLSRGHVAAAVVGIALLCTASFGAGVRFGRIDPRPVEQRGAGYLADAASEDLVALLARVETSGDASEGVDALTFPDALTQSSGGGLAQVDREPIGRFQVEVARFPDVADARALREHLRAAELQAWVAADLQAGLMSWRVSVGGFGAADEAEAGLTRVNEALVTWSGGALHPKVVSR